MSYTWTTGEVITAEKLNSMNNTEYDLELHFSATGNYESPVLTLTGRGLSVEELIEKTDNFEPVSWRITSHLNTEGTEFDEEQFTYNEGYAVSHTKPNNGDEQISINNAYFIINDEQFDFDGALFDYAYNSTTKEYTFTPAT